MAENCHASPGDIFGSAKRNNDFSRPALVQKGSQPCALLQAAAAQAKPKNPLFEPRPKQFGVGNVPKPVKDLTRFVKWPQYVRTQRQLRVLKMRLKVPPGAVFAPLRRHVLVLLRIAVLSVQPLAFIPSRSQSQCRSTAAAQHTLAITALDAGDGEPCTLLQSTHCRGRLYLAQWHAHLPACAPLSGMLHQVWFSASPAFLPGCALAPLGLAV
jgi:hypothetical protein